MYIFRFSQPLRILFGCALLVASVAAARADDYYSYSYSGPGISGSGTVALTAGPSDGTFNVTYIGGQVNGITIDSLLDPGTFHSNDNLFYGGDNYLDGQGVAFDLEGSGAQVGIYYDADEDDYYFVGDGNFVIDTGTGPSVNFASRFASTSDSNTGVDIQLSDFSFSPLADTATTPEPSGLVLLGTGVLAAAGMARRRFMKA